MKEYYVRDLPRIFEDPFFSPLSFLGYGRHLGIEKEKPSYNLRRVNLYAKQCSVGDNRIFIQEPYLIEETEYPVVTLEQFLKNPLILQITHRILRIK